MLDWEDFKYFSAAARTGSVRGAGKYLGVHASTVTRRLDQLEARLGTRLFARNRDGLMMTPAGAEVVQTLDDVSARLEDVARRLQGRDAALAGPVRINMPEAFDVQLFMPGLRAFSARYPQVVFEISRAWSAPDLDKREADLSVELTNAPPGHLIGRPLGRMNLSGYSHRDAAGDEGSWLASALERAVAPDYARRAFPELVGGGYLQSVDLQLAALLAGMGSTLLPCYLGDRHAQLRRLAPGAEGAELRRDIWLLSHPDSRRVARVQAAAEMLIETLRSQDLTGDQNNAGDVGSGH